MNRLSCNVLVDCFSKNATLTADTFWVIGFSLLTGFLAQLQFPLPFTPVPLTGQTFAVLLSGAVLGSRRGFASQALYLAEGAAGLPVFAGGAFSLAHLLGPTGGYLWSYPFAAGLVGWLVEQGAGRKFWKLVLSLFLADVLILASGASWLSLAFRIPPRQAWLLGFYPFVAGDVLKIGLVGAALPILLERYSGTASSESGR